MKTQKRMIRVKRVSEITGLPVGTVWQKAREGTLPKQVILTPRISAWVEEEIYDWIAARIAEREDGTAIRPKHHRGRRRAADKATA